MSYTSIARNMDCEGTGDTGGILSGFFIMSLNLPASGTGMTFAGAWRNQGGSLVAMTGTLTGPAAPTTGLTTAYIIQVVPGTGVISCVLGTPATTGTQAIPSPTAGNIALFQGTRANGQNLSDDQYATFIPLW